MRHLCLPLQMFHRNVLQLLRNNGMRVDGAGRGKGDGPHSHTGSPVVLGNNKSSTQRETKSSSPEAVGEVIRKIQVNVRVGLDQ
jgi:hypothetical protein